MARECDSGMNVDSTTCEVPNQVQDDDSVLVGNFLPLIPSPGPCNGRPSANARPELTQKARLREKSRAGNITS